MRTSPHALLGALVAGLMAAGSAYAAPMATVAQGKLEGVALEKADAYLGVPFAQPPVGALRWKAPVAAKKWSGVRKADKFSASCMQVLNPAEGRDPWTPEYLIPPGTSEDCLYLNVWTPHEAQRKKLPVLLWIHGGGNTEGSGSIPIYNGANLAGNGGIVVVTINYRLDVFGFLAHPELTKEGAGASGNYTHEDIVQSLKWVKANIAAFGGDPDQVTIAGQSAGAGNVHTLMGIPSAKGLFVRAIAESGSGIGPRGARLDTAEATGAAFAKQAGAKSLADLRKMPADAVLQAAAQFRKANPGQGFRAVIGGSLVPKDPTQAELEAGAFNDTPVLTGFNWDEGSGFEDAYGTWSAAEIQKRLDAFGSQTAAARAIYAPGGEFVPSELGKTLARDRGMAYTYAWAKRRSAASRNPIYIYQYMHAEPGPKQARYGSFHTNEVPYVFQNLDAPGRNFGPVDQQVSKTLSGYWLNFIKTGNPNGPGLVNWPAFDNTSESAARLGPNVTVSRVLPVEKRDLYEAYYSAGGVLSSR